MDGDLNGGALMFRSEQERWAALRARDPAADGRFFYSVRSTGVFCYPSCAARPALATNVAFHTTRDAAGQAGFRPCQRCRPDLPPRREREGALVARACRVIEAAEHPPGLAALAGEAGLSASHFHHLFRRVTGVTPKAYADARRQIRMQDGLVAGEEVTAALYDAGYASSGNFYAAADAALGMLPSDYRKGGAGETIRHAAGPCALGFVLVAVSGRGVCAILLGDEAPTLVVELRRRFPAASHVEDSGLRSVMAEVVALVDAPAGAADLALPLDIKGTVFQRRVWEALRGLSAGRTVTYGELAATIGAPRAVRAVASACGANPLAVAVPCHRVVAADGGLAGYRWGIERKRRLLARERGDDGH